MEINWELLGIMMGYAFFNGIGSFFFKKGLQKLDGEEFSFIRLTRENLRNLIRLFRNPIWVLGLVCLGIDFFIYQIALARFEVSKVKPLVNLNLIFVIFFGLIILNEKIDYKEWFGLIMIVSGAVLISINAKEMVPKLDLNAFWIFSLGGIFLVLFFILFLKISSRLSYELIGSIICGILYGMGSVYNKVLFVEPISTLYLILGGSFFTICYGFAFLFGQTAYLKGRMSIVSIIVNILSILTPFIGGALLFNESFIIESEQWFWRWSKILGVGLIASGIILNFLTDLSKHSQKNNKKKFEGKL